MTATVLAFGALPAGAAVSVIHLYTVPPGVFTGEVQEDGYISSQQLSGRLAFCASDRL